jgi:uncharacterized protein YkwD
MSRSTPEPRGRSGWLLLLIPLVATLGAGAWFGRSYVGDQAKPSTLASASDTSSKVNPAATAGTTASPSAKPGPNAAPAQAGDVYLGNVDLGKVSGRYVLKGPAKAPAGSVVVFVLSGRKRAVHTDSSAPYSFAFDSARLPNGTYTAAVTVIRPGLPTLSQNRLMEIRNTAPAKVTLTPAPSPTKKPGSSPAGGTTTTGTSPQAAKVLALTNAERAKVGCKALTINAKLTEAAQAHSADMAAKDYFAHDSQDGTSPFDRIKAIGYNFRAAAENIAYGQPTAASVMDAWMNSPGHKANILNCTYTQIGIGYALRSGTPYWTQDFGTPL